MTEKRSLDELAKQRNKKKWLPTENAKLFENLTSDAEICLASLEKRYRISQGAGLILLWISSLEKEFQTLTVEDIITLSWIGDKHTRQELSKLIQNTIDDFNILHGIYFNAPEWSEIKTLAYIKLRNLSVSCQLPFESISADVQDQISKMKIALYWKRNDIVKQTSDKLIKSISKDAELTDEEILQIYGSKEAYEQSKDEELKPYFWRS